MRCIEVDFLRVHDVGHYCGSRPGDPTGAMHVYAFTAFHHFFNELDTLWEVLLQILLRVIYNINDLILKLIGKARLHVSTYSQHSRNLHRFLEDWEFFRRSSTPQEYMLCDLIVTTAIRFFRQCV